jgi:hypothetical protein
MVGLCDKWKIEGDALRTGPFAMNFGYSTMCARLKILREALVHAGRVSRGVMRRA